MFLIIPCLASANETYICRFTGTVKIDGADAPDGTIITAIVGDDEYSTVTPTGYGTSTYSVTIQTNSGISYPDGTEVHFRVANCPALQTAIIESGKNLRLDLTSSKSSDCISNAQPQTSASKNTFVIVGLVFAFIAEVSLVGCVAYIAINDWNK